MWLNTKTEYSFLKVFGHLDKTAEKLASMADYGGIADLGNTFAYVRWRDACRKHKIKPIYGVQLPVVDCLQREERRYAYNRMTFIAVNKHGLQAIYELVRKSFDQFYYRQRITYTQVNSLSAEEVIVLSGVACRWDLIERYALQEISVSSPLEFLENVFKVDQSMIACIDNYYINPEDKQVYEPFAAERELERKTTLMHIPTEQEWTEQIRNNLTVNKSWLPRKALTDLKLIAEACNVELPIAPMVQYIGTDKIEGWCYSGAYSRKINIVNGEYADRLKRELKLIREKNYEDYFLIVADLIRYAKRIMTVGPARGSSAGSLVCYLMGITEVDPIKYGLYFERFIDHDRKDLPDVDIDFQDNKRYLILKYAQEKYGMDKVAQIANITKFKPKLAINHFARNLGIPLYTTEEIKNVVPERPSGDKRADKCIEDTFKENIIGKNFVENYPAMRGTAQIEGHASHAGKHAAGILVCPDPITDYASMDTHPTKDEKNKCLAMIDKKDAEKINLLKIDALGLREMTVIAEICDMLEKPYTWIYEIPLTDPAVYKMFNDHRYEGIFQFEGKAVQGLARQIEIESIEDLAALTALGRPGPMGSGGAQKYIRNRKTWEKIKEQLHAFSDDPSSVSGYISETCSTSSFWIDDHHLVIEATKETHGVIVYQEQVMRIMREVGLMSWEDVSKGRKIISKSVGSEAFDRLFSQFKSGCLKNGIDNERAENIWKHLKTMSNYAFNKSHAVSYSILSYICAYLKHYHPLEFVTCCLNNAKDNPSAVKTLRDAVEKEKIEYVYFDPERSIERWSVQDGILIGGLLSIDGIGTAAAKKIIRYRREGKDYPKGITSRIREMDNPFRYLYPARELYGEYYSELPEMRLGINAVTIESLPDEEDRCKIIGQLIKKQVRDKNETELVQKRGGRRIDGNSTYINITLEDDTGEIMCQIKPEDYRKLGSPIAENGQVNKDWYLVAGKRAKGFNLIFVRNIMKITKDNL